MTRLGRAARRVVRVLTRPVRAAAGRNGAVVQPYRGYGSRHEIFLIGRAFRQPGHGHYDRAGTLLEDLTDLGRRVLRHGLSEARLTARLGGVEETFVTDRDGYFRVHLRLPTALPADRLWHTVELDLTVPERVQAQGLVFVPPPECRFVVISDIDDTVMHTGVASKAVMLWRLFMEGADSRTAFAGIAAFLQALHAGRDRAEHNPMLYVSRAPWSNYEVLDAFFQQQGIPVGPVLFLREWGLTLQRPLPRRGKGHKEALIQHMLAVYRDLPFILIGDSGQRDPEIYARIVHAHPGRVLAVYIRNVSRALARQQAIEALAAEVAGAGSSLLLAADSLAMAEHAAAHGWVAAEALAAVRAEEAVEPEPVPHPPTRTVSGPTPEATRAAVEAGALDAPSAAADNVLVEPAVPGQREGPS